MIPHHHTHPHENPQHEIRVFETAQVRNPVQFAPYVSGPKPTMSQSARHTSYGMEAKSGVEETKMVASSTPWGKSYASTGNVQKVVLHGTTTNVTSAQDAENRITALSSALALRKTKALTPYHPRAWEELLCRYNLLRKYPTLPHQIQFGFDVGIRTIHRTFIPDLC